MTITEEQGPGVIDGATAQHYMDTFDAAPPEEQQKRLAQLDVYAKQRAQQEQRLFVEKSFTDIQTLGGTWRDDGQAWDDDGKAEVANRRLIAMVQGKSAEETMFAFPVLREQFAREKFGKSNLTNVQFYGEVQKAFEGERQRNAGREKIYLDFIASKIEGKEGPSAAERFQQWKGEFAQYYPNMDEAEMLETFAKAENAFDQSSGKNAELAGEIIKTLGAYRDRPQGAETDNRMEENFVTPEQMAPTAQKLLEASDEDRQRILQMVVTYAHAKGIDPKPFARRLIEAAGRSAVDVRAGVESLHRDSYLIGRENALNGITAVAGVPQEGTENWKIVGHFNPDDLAGSLDSVGRLPEDNLQGFEVLNDEQIAALKGEVEKQKKAADVVRDLRRVEKGELDPVMTSAKGLRGFFENATTGAATAVPFIATAAIPYAGLPLVTGAITSTEYDRIRTEYRDVPPEEAWLLAEKSGIAQGVSMMLTVRALEGLPVTANFVKSLGSPTVGVANAAKKVALNAAATGGELLLQGEITAGAIGLTDGFAEALSKDRPDVDWNKALSVFTDAQPGTFTTLLPFWLVGIGATSIRHIPGAMKMARSSEALQGLGIPKETADRIAVADIDQKDAMLRTAFEEMPDSQKQELVDRVDNDVAAAGQQQRSGRLGGVERLTETGPDGMPRTSLVVRDSKGRIAFDSQELDAATTAYRIQLDAELRREGREMEAETPGAPGEPDAPLQLQGPGASMASELQNRRIVYGADLIAEMSANDGTPNRALFDEAMRREYDGIEPAELDSIWQQASDAYLENQIGKETKPVPEIVRQNSTGETFEKTSPTSLKNAIVDKERRSRNLPPAMDSAKRSFGHVWDEAMRHMDENPQYQFELIQRLKADPTLVLTDRDSAILLQHQISVQNEYTKAVDAVNRAHESGDPAEIAAATDRASALLDELHETYDVGKLAGSAAGRALSIRRMMANEDYSLARMTARKMAAKGRKLTAEESALVEKQHADIEAKQKALDAKLEDIGAADRDARIEAIIRKVLAEKGKAGGAGKESTASAVRVARDVVAKAGARTVTFFEKQAEAARARIKERGQRFSAGVDPTVLADVAIIGASHIAKGTAKFAEWSERMVSEFGKEISPLLKDLYERSKAALSNRVSVDRVLDGLAARLAAGTEDMDLGHAANTLARAAIERGITKRDDLVEAVHGALSEVMPKVTKRETADAISGYGKFSELSKDQVSVALREAKGELQQISKIEDMQAGKAPQKTGMERRTPTAEERRLIAQVNELKKKGGYDVGDPGKALKSALDAIKTRLKNQIRDLGRRIETGEKPPERSPAPSDAQTESLTALRDRLKTTLEAIEGKAEATEAQRIDAAKKAVDRSIADLERRIANDDFGPTKKKGVTSPELEAARARRDALREEFRLLQQLDDHFLAAREAKQNAAEIARLKESISEYDRRLQEGDVAARPGKEKQRSPEAERLAAERDAMREKLLELRREATPKRSREEIALQALKTRTANRIAELRDRLARGDFSKPERKETALDAEAIALKADLELAKKAYDEGLFLDERARRSLGRKIFDSSVEIVNLARATMTSFDFSAVLRQGNFVALAHPLRAGKALVPMFKAFWSEKNQVRIFEEIRSRPNWQLYKQAGLYLADPTAHSLNKMEEAYMSRWAKYLPVVANSERAYTTFLNRLRADSFDAMSVSLSKLGTPTKEEAKAIANFVNVATGRGDIMAQKWGAGWNTLLFAPRFVASRFQLILGQPLYKGSASTRLLIASEYARYLAGLAVVYSLAGAAGATFEWDPRSSSFAKLRFGNTALDPMGGIAQATVLLSRLTTGETKTASGFVKPIRGQNSLSGQMIPPT